MLKSPLNNDIAAHDIIMDTQEVVHTCISSLFCGEIQRGSEISSFAQFMANESTGVEFQVGAVLFEAILDSLGDKIIESNLWLGVVHFFINFSMLP